MSGGIPPPPPHSTGMAWIGAALHFLPFIPKESCIKVSIVFRCVFYSYERTHARSPSLSRLNSPAEASVLCVERQDSSPCSQDPATGHT